MAEGDLPKQLADQPVRWRSIHLLMEGIAPVIRGYLDRQVEPIVDRIAALEKSLAELEAAQAKTLADAFRGTWQPGSTYARGSVVTWGGSLWLAIADTNAKCGTDDTWRMIVKRGKDATS